MSTYNIALLVALYFVISMTACAGFALFHVELCQYASALLANVSELSSKYLIAVISSVAMIANVYSCFCKSQNAELAQASKMVSATPVKRQSTRRASSNTPKSTSNTNSSSNSNATPMIVVEVSSNINIASTTVEVVSENSPSVLLCHSFIHPLIGALDV